MRFKIVTYLIGFGIFCWGLGLHSPISAWGGRLTAQEKISLIESAPFSIAQSLQKVQELYSGKVKFAHISRYQDQTVYQIGIVTKEHLRIVQFSPNSGKVLQVESPEKFWHWKRYFTSEEQEQFLQTPTDLLKAIRLVQNQQSGTVLGAYFKLEEGVHFYRVVLWAMEKKQIWIVDFDTEVAFLAKKNHE